jgi:hypothetical protein
MVIAPTALIAPVIAAPTRQVIADLGEEYGEELVVMEVGPVRRVTTYLGCTVHAGHNPARRVRPSRRGGGRAGVSQIKKAD